MAPSSQSNLSTPWSMMTAQAHMPSKYWPVQWTLTLFLSTNTPNLFCTTWNLKPYQMRRWHTQLTKRQWSKASKTGQKPPPPHHPEDILAYTNPWSSTSPTQGQKHPNLKHQAWWPSTERNWHTEIDHKHDELSSPTHAYLQQMENNLDPTLGKRHGQPNHQSTEDHSQQQPPSEMVLIPRIHPEKQTSPSNNWQPGRRMTRL